MFIIKNSLNHKDLISVTSSLTRDGQDYGEKITMETYNNEIKSNTLVEKLKKLIVILESKKTK